MLATVKSIALQGIEGYEINVEVDVNSGLPAWEIVGLPDTSVREAKERVRTAVKNTGIKFPSKRIVINLSPASKKKEGSTFDLPIAVGILINLGVINNETLKDYAFIGELSLDGRVNKVNGTVAMCIAAKNTGIKKVVIPYENRIEASMVKNLEIYPVNNLKEVIEHLENLKLINKFDSDVDKMLLDGQGDEIDFSDVKGQENVKRALEITAAGGHNAILIGSPGTGKTMISRRITTILPDLTYEEALEITRLHSIAGTLSSNTPIITKRPFRAPHHTTSAVALAGGGKFPKPGEMSLAHYGVLFLDELPEFDRNALETMRAPLEDRSVSISRINGNVTYPCNFMLVASMNPCPCGYANDLKRECTCTKTEKDKYIKKISGPILDRIDIHIDVPNVEYEKLNNNIKSESSAIIKERVNKARKVQIERYKEYKVLSNADLNGAMIQKFCVLKSDAQKALQIAFDKFGFSTRGYTRILKVARTIADLDGCEEIYLEHIMEAIQYRTLDRKL